MKIHCILLVLAVALLQENTAAPFEDYYEDDDSDENANDNIFSMVCPYTTDEKYFYSSDSSGQAYVVCQFGEIIQRECRDGYNYDYFLKVCNRVNNVYLNDGPMPQSDDIVFPPGAYLIDSNPKGIHCAKLSKIYYIVNEENRNFFYACINGIPSEYACPNQKIFDLTSVTCIDSIDTQQIAENSFSFDQLVNDQPQNNDIGYPLKANEEKEEVICVDPFPEGIECEFPQEHYFIEHEDNKNHFYLCYGYRVPSEMACPVNTVFQLESASCVPWYLANFDDKKQAESDELFPSQEQLLPQGGIGDSDTADSLFGKSLNEPIPYDIPQVQDPVLPAGNIVNDEADVILLDELERILEERDNIKESNPNELTNQDQGKNKVVVIQKVMLVQQVVEVLQSNSKQVKIDDTEEHADETYFQYIAQSVTSFSASFGNSLCMLIGC